MLSHQMTEILFTQKKVREFFYIAALENRNILPKKRNNRVRAAKHYFTEEKK